MYIDGLYVSDMCKRDTNTFVLFVAIARHLRLPMWRMELSSS